MKVWLRAVAGTLVTQDGEPALLRPVRVTRYPVTGLPPVVAGACHVRVAVRAVASRVTPTVVGTDGAVRMRAVPPVVGPDPTAVTARTVTV